MALRAVTSNGVAITPSSVSLPTGGTFDLYNTADQTTNYERLRIYWSGSIAGIIMQHGGSASPRAVLVGVSGSGNTYQFANAQSSAIAHAVAALPNAASGTQTVFSIAPAINQSGTAGYTAFEINPTETATGSGTKLLQRWAVGGTAQSYVTHTGVFVGTGLA